MSARTCGCDPEARHRCAAYPVCVFATELDTVCLLLDCAYIAFPHPQAGYDIHVNPNGAGGPLRTVITNIEMDGR